jgi:hypothetical protein
MDEPFRTDLRCTWFGRLATVRVSNVSFEKLLSVIATVSFLRKDQHVHPTYPWSFLRTTEDCAASIDSAKIVASAEVGRCGGKTWRGGRACK